MANERYKVIEGSQSAHCCFGYTIVDTENPEMHGDKQYQNSRTGDPMFEAICECWEESQANMIRDALNRP